MTAVSAGIVRSPLLAAVPDLVHGFTTRERGSMAGSIYPNEAQTRNRVALETELGLPLVKASQVHSADVVLVAGGRATRVRDGMAGPISSAMPLEADALVTRERDLALAVAVADCVPVLVAAGDWIGIAHAGWEGTTRNVVGALCDALATAGAPPRDWRAAIGPSIGPCCYEIDAARAAVVRERLGPRRFRHGAEPLLHRRRDRFTLDLWLAVRWQLADHGVEVVDALDVCTKDHVGTYFSHRGEDGRAGRGLAFIGWRPR